MKRFFLLLVCMIHICICNAQNHLFIVENEATGMKGCMDINKKLVVPYEYEQIIQFGDYFLTEKMSKVGLINPKGQKCVSNSYGYGAHVFTEKEVIWCSKNEKWGLIDFKENVLIPFIYDDIDDTKGELLSVMKNGSFGVISIKEKKEVIPCQYENIMLGGVLYSGPFGDVVKNEKPSDLIAVKKNNKWGFVNSAGALLIPFKYESSEDDRLYYKFTSGRSAIMKNGLVGLINEKGEEVVPPKYKLIRMGVKHGSHPEYPTAITVSGKEVIINKQNKEHTAQYDEVWADKNGVIYYKKSDKWGIISLDTGKEITQPIYEAVSSFSEGYVKFVKNGKVGYVNLKGREVFSNDFDKGWAFKNGYCVVEKNGKYGYLKSDGNSRVFIDCIYDDAFNFHTNGLASVKKGDKFGCISTRNKIVLPFEYDRVNIDDENGIICVKLGEKFGFFDIYGKEIVPCEYSLQMANIEKAKYLANHNRNDDIGNSDGIQLDDYDNVDNTSQDGSTKPFVLDKTIDESIPNTTTNNTTTFAVIIGNERYTRVAQVQYAANDAKIFAEYCQKTLGIPANNVRQYNNATFGTMLSAMNDIKNIAEAYQGNVNVIFYYAGHGVPNEQTHDAFLLPVDADGKQTEACYPVSRLYKDLGSLGAKNVVVFMDACFSGSQRGEGMLASARGVALKAKAEAPQGNMVVFSAATGDETAYPYKEKGHGMFTYFLLKKLQESKGDCTLGELGEYIQQNVRQQSVVINRKSQTPTVVPSHALQKSWQTMKLR